ncbi:MAG: arginine--tRNA ligase [Clostridia bacterium]|nr:arginine--tRNA ligase [Clostridia bacterium]
MSNLMKETKDKIDALLHQAFDAAVSDGALTAMEEFPTYVIEEPKNRDHGDLSTNLAMQMARAQRSAPQKIAQALVDHMTLCAPVEKVDIAGAGFINFTLNENWLTAVLPMIEKEGKNYGRVSDGNGEKVLVEFVSANPTGPMHMGNARGGALGDCLAEVLDWAGHEVSREFYVNDAGNQIEKFANSLEARYMQLVLGSEEAWPFPEDGYHGDDIRERAQAFLDQEGDRFRDADPKERRDALVAFGLKLNIDALHAGMDLYRIHYDEWFRESSLYASGEVEETLSLLKKSGYTYEKEGALWFKSSEFVPPQGEEEAKDDVLVRANGIPTYFAADIAYHRNKLEKRGFDRAIDIWGADHHGHIARMKGALSALGINPDRFQVVIMQLVRLLRNGEVARMSKRAGKTISLTDLLEETGVDAARFLFNLRAAGSHLDFDLDLAVAQSNENPVYYVQYAHARICSILRLAEEEGIVRKKASELDLSVLKATEEKALLNALAQLPEEVSVAAKTCEPSKMTHYVMDLAAAFHTFYGACRVRCEDEALQQARLALCAATRDVIKNVLTMLGVTAPDRM